MVLPVLLIFLDIAYVMQWCLLNSERPRDPAAYPDGRHWLRLRALVKHLPWGEALRGQPARVQTGKISRSLFVYLVTTYKYWSLTTGHWKSPLQEERMSVRQALAHPWLSILKQPGIEMSEQYQISTERLRTYYGTLKWVSFVWSMQQSF